MKVKYFEPICKRVRIYFGNYFFLFWELFFFSMVSIGGGDVSGGGGLSLQRR